jgi:glutamate racemase
VRAVAAEYLEPLREVDVDVIILGCTHYPLLREVLQDQVGPDVRLVDSGEETAATVAHVLSTHHLEAPRDNGPGHMFFVSDSPMRFRDFGRHFSDGLVDAVAHVDIDGFGLHIQRLDDDADDVA